MRKRSRHTGGNNGWDNPRIAAARKKRYAVKVGNVGYRSVASAFKVLGIDAKHVIPFRAQLRDAPNHRGRMGGYTFTMIRTR